MNNNDYGKYIGQLIPTTLENIYIMDMMSDFVMEYSLENDIFVCKSTIPFTNFYSNLEKNIHSDDIKGYIDSISPQYLQNNLNKGIDHIRYEYRKNLGNEKYDWYSNVTKLMDINGKKLTLVLVENINDSAVTKEDNKLSVVEEKDKQQRIIDAVTSAIVKINSVININAGTTNPELKTLTNYINEELMNLAHSFPELNQAISNNMIASTNQGTTKTLLVVDDDQMTCNILNKTFEDTYKIIVAHNGQEAIDILESNTNTNSMKETEKIVGMFLDLNMPVIDGFGVLDYMSSKNLLSKMPVIIISGDYDRETKERAYLYKIDDVLEKPFNVQVVKHRIQTFVNLYRSNNSLNEVVLTQHQDIKNVLKTMVSSYFYDYGNDIKRVSTFVGIIAKQLSNKYPQYKFDENRLNKLIDAARYYNVGMYALPAKISEKETLTEDEKKIIEGHPFIGISIFDSVLYRVTDNLFNNYAKEIIEYHEENYDGSGYPHRYSREKIPLSAQIAAVAIEYNELSKIIDEELILNEIEKYSNIKFNPLIVECLRDCIDELKNVK